VGFSMKTKLSIVTPSYNQGSYIEETLKSVCSQRSFIHEYFVVDGGSTDNSVDIIRKYTDQIDWWVSERDKGQTDAIIKGFNRATGDVIAWLNSDDIYLPGALEAVQAEFDKDPELEILTGYMVQIDEKNAITRMRRVPAPNKLLIRQGFVYVTQPTTFFRRSLYERAGGLDVDLHCTMDSDLWCRFYRLAPVWKTLHRYIVGFRGHSECKGLSEKWVKQYAAEGKLMGMRYPDMYNSPSGLWLYRGRQALTGAEWISLWHTWMFKGKNIQCLTNEVLGS
jgi:glycosyltransferase involved in cell wall biosynthesis